MCSSTIVGITGGIGSGKSVVSKCFSAAGYPVYDSDSRAKWLIKNDSQIRSQIIFLLGEEAFTSKGYNREYVASRVFNDKDLLEGLNNIVHPAVKKDFETFCMESNSDLIFKETALLFQSNDNVDMSIFVSAPKRVKIERILQRDSHRTQEDIEKIMLNQFPESKGCLQADFVIVNDETESVLTQIEEILEILSLE